MKYIISGNWAQFESYRQKLGYPLGIGYVSDVSYLRGVGSPEGVFVGTWYLRPDIDIILQQLCMASSNGRSPGLQLAIHQLEEYRNAQQRR